MYVSSVHHRFIGVCSNGSWQLEGTNLREATLKEANKNAQWLLNFAIVDSG